MRKRNLGGRVMVGMMFLRRRKMTVEDSRSVHSESHGSESEDTSEQLANPNSSAGISKTLRKLVRDMKGKDGEAWKLMLDGLVEHERRVASLEKKSVKNSGESGLCLTLNIL